jgi:integrase
MSTGERVHGPYPHRRGFRVTIVVGRQRRNKQFADREAALAFIAECRKLLGARTVEVALGEYVQHLLTRGANGRPNRPRTVETTEMRLRGILGPVLALPVAELTENRAATLYGKYARDRAPDTHRNTLGQARTFGKFCAKRGWAKANPWSSVEPEGQRSAGKPQLEPDEARVFARVCLNRALVDDGALAGLLCLYLGLRASEVVSTPRRAVNLESRVLSVHASKTKAGIRRLLIPEELVMPLARRVEIAAPLDRLLPYRREWVRDSVMRLCEVAGVPVVCAHGLRGTWASLGSEGGAAVEVVARELGQSGTAVARKHYIAPGTLERVQADRARGVLS